MQNFGVKHLNVLDFFLKLLVVEFKKNTLPLKRIDAHLPLQQTAIWDFCKPQFKTNKFAKT